MAWVRFQSPLGMPSSDGVREDNDHNRNINSNASYNHHLGGGTLSVPTAVIGAIITVAFNIPNYPIRITALKSVPFKLQCANELLGILR